MKLPPIKRFLTEDYPTEKGWIDRFFGSFNLFMTAISNGLNNGMTIQDNMLAQIKPITISGASPSSKFAWKFSGKPIGVLVIGLTKSDGSPSLVTASVTCDWSFSQGFVLINNVTGLNPGASYLVTFYVIGG